MTAAIQTFLFDPGTPGDVSQQRAQELIEPFLPRLARATQDAFKEFHTGVLAETRAKLYPGVRGQHVTNLIWEHVRDGLTELDGVEFCDRLGFFKVIVENEIVVRFKRLNNDLLAASDRTDQAVDWFGNRSIDGIPDHLLRVNFGYRPEPDWLSCENFYFTHQSSFTSLAWLSGLRIVSDDVSATDIGAHGLPALEVVPIQPPVPEEKEKA